MKIAALDLGTNTFLCLIAEVEAGQIKKVYADEVRVVRLGQGVHATRQFHPEALVRARQCLQEYAALISKYNVQKIVAVTTSAARDVTNADELFKIGNELKIPIQVFSGDQEAEFTFSGAFVGQGRSEEPKMVIDIGGGSTEFIFGNRSAASSQIENKISLDIGAVRLTEMFVTKHPITKDEYNLAEQYVRNELSKIVAMRAKDVCYRSVAVAGTPTTLAAVVQGIAFSPEKIDGYFLSHEVLVKWEKLLSEMTVVQRQNLIGMEPKRADVLPMGVLILRLACEVLSFEGFYVSTKGLRYGIAAQAEAW